MRFSWDETKNVSNRRKHGMSFHEAQELLESGHYLETFDEEHADREERFIAIGLIRRGLIVVVWMAPDEGTVRIVSARFATKREARLFEAHTGERCD